MIDGKVSPAIEGQLNAFYYNHQHETIHHLLPKELIELADHKVEDIADLLCERAKVYLNSDKGAHDIYDMLDTFSRKRKNSRSSTNVYDKGKYRGAYTA